MNIQSLLVEGADHKSVKNAILHNKEQKSGGCGWLPMSIPLNPSD